MRTHPDIGLVIADLLRLAHFWLCNSAEYVTSNSAGVFAVFAFLHIF